MAMAAAAGVLWLQGCALLLVCHVLPACLDASR
jgi:hypothetical protein